MPVASRRAFALHHGWDVNERGDVGLLFGVRDGYAYSPELGLKRVVRAGGMFSAWASEKALQRLAKWPGLAWSEISRKHIPHRDLADQSVLYRPDSLTVQADTHTYTLKPANLPPRGRGKVTVRVYTAYSSKDKKPELLPQLQLCGDAACTKVLATDVGAMDQPLPTGVTDPTPKPVSHAIATHVFDASDGNVSLTIQIKGLSIVGSGRYVLVVSSGDVPLKQTDLTGGTVSQTSQPRLMGHASAIVRTQHKVDGKGVVIGVIDTGIDWCHKDFLDANGKSRILALWDQTISPQNGEVSPDVGEDGDPKNDYGVLYTKQQLDAALPTCDRKTIRTADTNGHGSHVAGIAAASGPLPGMAPGADLVIVKYTFFSKDQPTAIDFLMREAKKRNQPIVINMSLGSLSGPKDGTSSSERNLTGVIGPGRNIVVSAGNYGSRPYHARGTVDPAKPMEVKLRYTKSSSYRGGTFGFYSHHDDRYTLTLTAPDGKTYKAAWGQRQQIKLADKTVYLYAGTSRLERVMYSLVSISYQNPTPATEDWVLTIERTTAKGDGKWQGYVMSSRSNARFQSHFVRNKNGSYAGTLGSPAVSPGSLTVASYSMRYAYDATKNPVRFYVSYRTFGNLAPTSSRGPTGDGRPGVTIGAPGQYILSTNSSQRPIDNSTLADKQYRAISGTSMSAPMVAGVAALFLQKDPTLFVRPLVQTAARVPDCCSPADPNQWGAGMLQTLGALELLAKTPAPTIALTTKGNVTEGQVPLVVTLEASSPRPLVEFHWDLNGDGRTDVITNQPTLTHTFAKAGTMAVSVLGINTVGKSAKATVSLILRAPPTPEPRPEPKVEPGPSERILEGGLVGDGGSGPVPPEVSTREPTREPVSPDKQVVPEQVMELRPEVMSREPSVGQEPVLPEKQVAPDAMSQERVGVETTNGRESGVPDVALPPPGDACGCGQLGPGHSSGSPISLAWLLLLFWWGRRRDSRAS
jgi:uncharacterized protein (TIGR03382 family)